MSDTAVNLVVGVALVVGVVGLIVPVLPGTVLIAGALLVWAMLIGGTSAWVALAIMGVLLAVGQVLKYLLPGRSMTATGIPGRSIMVGGIAGVIGFFVIPVVGIIVGFVAGVYIAEQLRLQSWEAARRSTWVAMKATGFSVLIELTAALLAVGVWLGALVQIG